MFDINTNSNMESKITLINRMNKIQKHRGPDDEGIYSDRNVILGHVRLSIVDLSFAGHQPMGYMEKYEISFNGEIYNYIELREELQNVGYKFSTRTDTEVIMAAYDYWGEDCQNHFNGFWAFALYVIKSGELFLSRDRFGVKPLYYAMRTSRIIFSSEIKSLLEDSEIERIANDKVILDYLVNGFVDCSEETFFKGIYGLPSGCSMLIYDNCEFKIKRYYFLDYKEKLDSQISNETIQQFQNLFDDSIRLRLRADVPIGSCLSGGLDSSSIVCHANKLLKDSSKEFAQKTFSSCYTEKTVDERLYIEEVVKMTGVDAFYTYPTADAFLNDFDSLIFTQDEPFVSTSMYASYCVMRLAKENKVKVLLDGQGSDEILCGYRKARIYYIKVLIKKKKIIRAIKETVLYLPYILKTTSTLSADIGMFRQFIGREDKNSVKRKYLNNEFAKLELNNSYKHNDTYLLNDFSRIVLPALLRYVDRNSMAFSIEDRLPFLDYRFVEFCMKLPLNTKINQGYSKYIMRKALMMPDKVRRRKDKIGFATPEKSWLKQFASEYKVLFESKDFRAKKYIDNNKILEHWDDIITEKDNIGIFRYACLEKWMRIFNVYSES